MMLSFFRGSLPTVGKMGAVAGVSPIFAQRLLAQAAGAPARGADAAAGSTPSLYEQLGGSGKAEVAIEAVVNRFYEKLLAKPEISPFFEGIDMKKQKKHQTTFITLAFGGPVAPYVGRGMNPAHARVRKMGITDAHFDTVVSTLGDTMKEFKLTDAQIKQAAAVAESTREQIMGRAP